jgi:hypothetical protein
VRALAPPFTRQHASGSAGPDASVRGRAIASDGGLGARSSPKPSSADPKPEAIVSVDDRCRIDAAAEVAGVALLLHASSSHGEVVTALHQKGA